MDIAIRPLTGDLWPALEGLFADSPVTGRCWCMYPRIGATYRKRPAADNRRDFRDLVRQGPPPGLLAFDGEIVAGWCQLTPRAAVPWLDRINHLRRMDDLPVWCLTCLYIRKTYRRKSVSAQLIAAAVEAARKAGAPAIEAYPLDADLSPSATGTGYMTTFARAGFVEVARRIPARPVMRLTFRAERTATERP